MAKSRSNKKRALSKKKQSRRVRKNFKNKKMTGGTMEEELIPIHTYIMSIPLNQLDNAYLNEKKAILDKPGPLAIALYEQLIDELTKSSDHFFEKIRALSGFNSGLETPPPQWISYILMIKGGPEAAIENYSKRLVQFKFTLKRKPPPPPPIPKKDE